jgi:hypothetical protein
VETATIGEVLLFAVGLAGSVVGAIGLRDAVRRHGWIRWSGNERARRVSRRRVRAAAARIIGCVVAAIVGAVATVSPGWFFRGAGPALAFGLGATVLASTLDVLEQRRERLEPDVRAELDLEDIQPVSSRDGSPGVPG